MEYKSYISNLTISETFKEQLLCEKFLASNPAYYQNYPSLFANAFSVENSELQLLDISGFLYYQATIFTDSFIDENKISNFPLISVCQEESIKILTHIFGLQNNFWSLWNDKKNQYLYAIQLEKELLKKPNVSIEEYEKLADYKAAFGKVAIDCLYCIDQSNTVNYQKLLMSHKYFATAFQLNDDIQDFKEDMIKGQFNYAVYLLDKENIMNSNPNILEKYLYIKGVAKKIYTFFKRKCIINPLSKVLMEW